ncbi:hypothetical protein Tco_0614846 [Tanacetum coccineum]
MDFLDLWKLGSPLDAVAKLILRRNFSALLSRKADLDDSSFHNETCYSINFAIDYSVTLVKEECTRTGLGNMENILDAASTVHIFSEIPRVESLNFKFGRDETADRGSIVIQEHVLDFLLTTMEHSEEADNPVPRSVSNLVVHIIDTHVDHLEDVVTKLDIQKAI